DLQNPTAAEYAAIDTPTLTITGAYDDDQPGALAHYERHVSANASARDRHHLLIGPWDHSGTRSPVKSVGGLELGPASMIDIANLHVEWFSCAMSGGSRPELLKRR